MLCSASCYVGELWVVTFSCLSFSICEMGSIISLHASKTYWGLARDDVYTHAVSVTCDGDLLEIQTEAKHKRTIK